MRLEEEEGWVSFIYTKKERRPAFRYRINKRSGAGVRFVTIVAPYPDNAPPKISALIVGKPKPGASKLQLRVTTDGVSKIIGYEVKGE
jgi:heparan-sulfate lyase